MPTRDTESLKGAVSQAQDSVHVRRGTKVASEDDSMDQHLRNSFNILKRWRTGRWSKAPGNDHLLLHSSTGPSRKKLPSIDPQFTTPASLSFFVIPWSDSLVTTIIAYRSTYICFDYGAVHKVRHARGGGGPRRCDSL